MKKYWFTLGGVTSVATLIILTPFLPERAEVEITPSVLPKTLQEQSIKVLFVGDIMLDRSVALHGQEVGDERLFVGVEELFKGHDAIIANLEGSITTNPSLSQNDSTILRFTFEPKYADLLARLGFSAMSLANNHSLDFGGFGYQDTLQYLNTAGIGAFGAPFNDVHIALQLLVGDKRLCLVGYHELFNPDITAVIVKIKAIRGTCDHVVLFAHWGIEYRHAPTLEQREFAHAFIDAGADVVIGAHPHVVEPLEIYNNHAIFYSLGNFLFDQGFQPEVMRGLAVAIEFSASSTKFSFIPVNTFKEVSVADAVTTEAVLSDLGVMTSSMELVR